MDDRSVINRISDNGGNSHRHKLKKKAYKQNSELLLVASLFSNIVSNMRLVKFMKRKLNILEVLEVW